MKVVRITYPLSADVRGSVPAEGQTIAIGDFDGVHLGHREVIGRAKAAASRFGVPTSVMTFHPHPREVLGSPVYSAYLTPLEDKLERIRALGVDTVYLVSFDKTFAALSPNAFVEEVLTPLGVKSVAVGFNFSFGHRGIGTSAALRDMGEGVFETEIVEPFLVNGERVSSTLVREALAFGDVKRAASLLGRPFAVSGVVVPGDGRGRTIGVPTANLSVTEPYVKPANGVYAVHAAIESGPDAGRRLGGVINVGLKPTFHNNLKEPTWETHLFDFEGDLYGQRMTIGFADRIRDERKFDSVGALIDQIRSDIEEAKTLVR